jgi:hypothetical protein
MSILQWAIVAVAVLAGGLLTILCVLAVALKGDDELRARRFAEANTGHPVDWDAWEREFACPDCGQDACERCPRWEEDPGAHA